MTRTLLSIFFALRNDLPGDNQYNIELANIEIHEDEIPKISDGDFVPVEMLNYVRKIGLDYLSDMFKKVEAKKSQLPQEFYRCLKTEIRIVSQRIHSIRAYAIHKISKMKAQQCMVEHRLEEWMIYSIKHRNRQIYQKCNYLKECVEKVGLADSGRRRHLHAGHAVGPSREEAGLQLRPQSRRRDPARTHVRV